MERWLTRARRLCTGEEAFAIVEYGLLLALLALIAIAAISLLGSKLSSFFALAASSI
jgi:Flp pilus assembly pilin Flp